MATTALSAAVRSAFTMTTDDGHWPV
jgi:hypothetical protein